MKALVFLCKVEASFLVPRRAGISILPGLPFKEPGMPRVRVNDKIELRTPNGTVIDTYIAAIAHAKTTDGSVYPIQLPADIKKEDVPPGTEMIWLEASV